MPKKNYKSYNDMLENIAKIDGLIKPKLQEIKQEENQLCPACGGDSWKFNSVKTTIKYCKCGNDF